MLIPKQEYESKIKELVKERQLYGLLRRAQKRIAERNFSRFCEFTYRNCFTSFAEILTQKFFPKAKESLSENIKRAYIDWLVLAPIISSYKWLPKPGMHRAHYLTWARRNCNILTRQWFFVQIKLQLPSQEELVRRAVTNACQVAGVKDIYWLEQEFQFLAHLCFSSGLKSRLAKWILLPWAFLDIDKELDKKLEHSKHGWAKEIARAGKKGSASYFRLGNEIWIFATEEIAEKINLPWKDLRNEKANALDYIIWYEEGVIQKQRKKTVTGGLQIALQEKILQEIKNEAKAIAHHRSMSPKKKFFKLNELAKKFIKKHRFAVSAGMQFLEIGRIFKDLVRSKIAPTLGPEAIGKGFYPKPDDIDRSLYFKRFNPFFDPK